MLVSNLSLLKWNLCESILMEHLLLLSRQTRPTNPRSSECSCQIKPLFWGFFWQVWHVQGCGLFHQFACCLSLLLQFSHLYILEKAKLLTKRSQPINGHFPPTEKCSSFGHPSIHGTWHYLPYGFVNLTDNATLLASRVETFPGTQGISKLNQSSEEFKCIALKSFGKIFYAFNFRIGILWSESFKLNYWESGGFFKNGHYWKDDIPRIYCPCSKFNHWFHPWTNPHPSYIPAPQISYLLLQVVTGGCQVLPIHVQAWKPTTAIPLLLPKNWFICSISAFNCPLLIYTQCNFSCWQILAKRSFC